MSEVKRVYFKEAAYVGTESYQSIPPVSDNEQPRRAMWAFGEEDAGVRITFKPLSGASVSEAFVPWGNIKGVVYFDAPVQNAPAQATPAGGKAK